MHTLGAPDVAYWANTVPQSGPLPPDTIGNPRARYGRRGTRYDRQPGPLVVRFARAPNCPANKDRTGPGQDGHACPVLSAPDNIPTAPIVDPSPNRKNDSLTCGTVSAHPSTRAVRTGRLSEKARTRPPCAQQGLALYRDRPIGSRFPLLHQTGKCPRHRTAHRPPHWSLADIAQCDSTGHRCSVDHSTQLVESARDPTVPGCLFFTLPPNKEPPMSSKILTCNCKHDHQDQTHGLNKRVHNMTAKKTTVGGKEVPIYRCTVCGAERTPK